MAEDLLRELTAEGQDTPTSQLSFVANQDPEDEKLAKKVMRDVQGSMGTVNKWRSAAREDDRYYFGWQWPDLDKMRMEQQRRPALTFNEIGPKIDAISGIERLNRAEVRFQSRPLDSDVAHDAAGDLATESVALVEDNSDGEKEDSEAIKDALKAGMGWTEIYMDYQVDEDGEVRKRHTNKYEMVWDRKSYQNNLADRTWHGRVKNYSRKDFEKRWPDMIDIIDQSAVYYQEDSIEKYELVTPYYSLANERSNPAIQEQPQAAQANVPVIQYQWIDNTVVYRIADPQNPDQLVTLTEDQWKNLQKKSQLSGNPPPKAVRQIKGVYKQVYVALGVVLEDPVVLPDFTFKCITGQYDSEKKIFYGLVRNLKDPQSTENKSISSLVAEYITNAKGGVLWKTGTWADQAMAKQQWSAYDAWIEVNPNANIQTDILQREPKQVSQFPSMLFEQARDAMTRTSGVSDEMSGIAQANATGPTIDRRLQAGLAILGWLWDNIERYKKSVASTELEFIREYWSHGQFVNIGGNFNSQSVPLLKSDLPIKYALVMDQSVRYNPNLKNQVWQDVLQIAGPLLKIPAGQQILLKALKFSPFPTQLVQEIQQAVAQAPPQPPKGRQPMQPKQDDPNLIQAKIQKMGAETQRTMAETRKLDHDSSMGVAQFAVDTLHRTADTHQKAAVHQHKAAMDRHKALTDRVKAAQEAQQRQQEQLASMFQQPTSQPMGGPPQGIQ
jgi:hypothetical protein